MPTTPFLNMFGRSPIRPLEAHMSQVHACVKELGPFFQAVMQQDWVLASSMQQSIAHLEHLADNMKRELRSHLPKSLFMPFSRSDLLDLLNVQDRLANKAKDIAGVVLGRKMVFPEQIISAFLSFLSHNIEASRQANTAIHELDELLETSFSGNEIKIVDDIISKLSSIEHETDDQQIAIRQHLFLIEKEWPPIDVMFLYKIVEWTGDIADRAQVVGDRLQILLVR